MYGNIPDDVKFILIPGIQQRLDHFTDLGVDTFLLDTILENGNQQKESLESGYDVTNFMKIDSAYGSLVDVDNLINKTHNKGEIDLVLILDVVPLLHIIFDL
jgi:glycosidase